MRRSFSRTVLLFDVRQVIGNRIGRRRTSRGPLLSFEQFLDSVPAGSQEQSGFKSGPTTSLFTPICHAKSLTNPAYLPRLTKRLPGRKVTLLDTGCCGMAGAFGALEAKYELSLKVAEPLIGQLQRQPERTVVVASGTSCRHQIEHLTAFRPKHMAELMAEALIAD